MTGTFTLYILIANLDSTPSVSAESMEKFVMHRIFILVAAAFDVNVFGPTDRLCRAWGEAPGKVVPTIDSSL